jgi:hypothetical protein
MSYYYKLWSRKYNTPYGSSYGPYKFRVEFPYLYGVNKSGGKVKIGYWNSVNGSFTNIIQKAGKYTHPFYMLSPNLKGVYSGGLREYHKYYAVWKRGKNASFHFTTVSPMWGGNYYVGHSTLYWIK